MRRNSELKQRIRRLRSSINVNWFSYRVLYRASGVWALLGIISFLAGVTSLLGNLLRFQASSVNALSVLLLAGGAAGFLGALRRFRSWVREIKDVGIYDDPDVKALLPLIRVSEQQQQQGYRLVEIPNRSEWVIANPKLDQILQDGDFDLSIDEACFRRITDVIGANPALYDSALRSHHAFCRANDKEFFNEAKACLARDLEPGEPGAVFRSTYFHSFLTNELCTRVVETKGETPTTLYRGKDYFPAVPRNDHYVMKSISDSYMNNHIGISTLVFTRDKKLILWRQSDKAQQSGRLIVPTGSGSADWADFAKLGDAKSLRNLVSFSMEREFKEESHPLKDALKDANIATRMLGYFRWIKRGGKPEFVGTSVVDKRSEELRPNLREVDKPVDVLNYPAHNRDALLQSIEDILALKTVSVPLHVNLLCLGAAVRLNPQVDWTDFAKP